MASPAEPRLRPKSRYAFQVAILCALSKESDAVIASLDHVWTNHDDIPENERIDKLPQDPNSYTYGAIGRHNVVLVHLSRMGTVEASSVSAYLRTSFPNISLCGVVGICGVQPGKDDIERERILGDVIISTSILTYDSGRELDSGFQQRTGIDATLLDLPNELRGFLHKQMGVFARQELEKQIRANVRAIQEAKCVDAVYPGKAVDRAFASNCLHGDMKRSCDELGCGSRGEIYGRKRLREEDEDPSPLVHFGVVASANRVMRAAKRRDEIAKADSAIAFEMEGAGAWRNLPCLVIKGACDYSDGHKHKDWQNYAAVTAAACLKGLLREWMPSGIGEQYEAEQLLYKKHLQAIKIHLSPPMDGIKSIARFDADWLVRQSAFKRWAALDRKPSEMVPPMLTVKGKMFSGKSVLLKESFVQKAKDAHSLVLYHFFNGGIKEGKSFAVFLRHVLSQLLNRIPDIPSDDVIEWTMQMEQDKMTGLWSDESLEEIIKNIIVRGKDMFVNKGKNLVLFVDGVNECSDADDPSGTRSDGPLLVLQFLQRLLQHTEAEGIDFRICISRQPAPDYGQDEPPIETTVVALDEYANKEVQRFVAERLEDLDPVKATRVMALLKKQWCDDFHWATLKIKAIIQETFSIEEEEDAILSIHGDYEIMYTNALKSFHASKAKHAQHHAMTLLHLCLGSYRVLTLHEFRQAIAYSGEAEFDTLKEWTCSHEGLPAGAEFERFVRSRTKSLLDISAYATPPVGLPATFWDNTEHLNGLPRVVFSHHSAEIFVRGERGIAALYPNLAFEEASALLHRECHRLMFQICLNVLERCNMVDADDKHKGMEIRDYACEFWLHHAKECGELPDDFTLPSFLSRNCGKKKMQEIMKHQHEFLKRSRAREYFLLRDEQEEPDKPQGERSKPLNSKPSLMLMMVLATMGCTQLLEKHTQRCKSCQAVFTPKEKSNMRSSQESEENHPYALSLRIAMEQGHTDTAVYLLERFPLRDINMVIDNCTLLYRASYFAAGGKDSEQVTERLKCIDILLERGADPTKESQWGYRYPLFVAIKTGNILLLKKLLQRKDKESVKAMFTATTSLSGYTALHFAVVNYNPSKPGTLRALVGMAPDGKRLLAMKDKKGRTPKHLAESELFNTPAENRTILDHFDVIGDDSDSDDDSDDGGGDLEEEHEPECTVVRESEDNSSSSSNLKRKLSINLAESEGVSSFYKRWKLSQRES